MVPARVECHSGYRADERPERFTFGAERHDVRQVLDRWRTPAEEGYRVRAACGRVFVLRLDTSRGEWTVEGKVTS
jgi:hypothetical protein